MNEMLLLRSIQLSSINDLLKVRLRRAHRPWYWRSKNFREFRCQHHNWR